LEDLTDEVLETNKNLSGSPQHQGKINQFYDRLKLLEKDVETHLLDYRIDTRLSSLFRSKPGLEVDWKKCQDLVESVRHEAQTAIEAISGERAGVAAAKSRAVFDSLAKNHKSHENFWAWWSGISAAILIAAIVILVFCPEFSLAVSSPVNWIEPLLRRVILLSLPLVSLRVGLQKYNIERHMRTTYEHHKTIMEQFTTIEELLASDQESREGFRMEVARTILALPSSGYLDGGRSAGELNISPIIGFTEKLMKGSPGS